MHTWNLKILNYQNEWRITNKFKYRENAYCAKVGPLGLSSRARRTYFLDRSNDRVAATKNVFWTARIIESRPPRMYFEPLELSSCAHQECILDRSDY